MMLTRVCLLCSVHSGVAAPELARWAVAHGWGAGNGQRDPRRGRHRAAVRASGGLGPLAPRHGLERIRPSVHGARLAGDRTAFEFGRRWQSVLRTRDLCFRREISQERECACDFFVFVSSPRPHTTQAHRCPPPFCETDRHALWLTTRRLRCAAVFSSGRA